MRYLVDECLGHLVVAKLRDRGHDVQWVREIASGTPDESVLDLSVRDSRVLFTEDFDHGDLVFARGHAAVGVVILQMSDFPGSWDDITTQVVERLDALQSGFRGNLTILGRRRVKVRPLPAG